MILSNDTAPLDRLHDVFREHLYLPDTDIIDFAVAVAVANRLGGDPVWAFIVGPPSVGKTEALQALTGLPETHSLSKLTPNTLLSGRAAKGTEPSLLLRLPPNALLVLKDFTTILSLRDDARAEILGQFREVYDGQLVAEYGTGLSIRWEGRVGFLAGVTPAIDSHHAVISVLGERFLYLRTGISNRRTLGARALRVTDGNTMRAELRAAVSEFVSVLDMMHPALSDDVRDQLVGLADITTWARSGVQRDRFSRDIEVAPTLEAPARFVKQIRALWEALVVMGHPDPIGFVRRIAFDSIPPARSAAVRGLAARDTVSSTELRRLTRLSSTAHRRLLEDLEALGLAEIVTHGADGRPHIWGLESEAKLVWDTAFSLTKPHPQYQEEGEKEKDSPQSVDIAGGVHAAEMVLTGATL
jgi:hypothetical protein